MEVIQIDKTYLINQRYQILIISMLKNLSYKYFSHYFIKIMGFIPIYYIINLNIVLFYMVFIYLYLGSMNLLQV